MTDDTTFMELEEISTAKDIVWDVLDTEHQDGELADLPEDVSFIDIAAKIVDALVEAGVYIPQDIERPEGFYEMDKK